VWQPIGKLQMPQPLLKFAVQEFDFDQYDLDPNQIRVMETSAPALYAPDKAESLHFALFNAKPKAKPQGSAIQ
jgi:hypothetical protein